MSFFMKKVSLLMQIMYPNSYLKDFSINAADTLLQKFASEDEDKSLSSS